VKNLFGINKTLGGDRFICISRELTKIHETFHVGRVSDIRAKMSVSSSKGEFTLVVAPEGYTL
jgi:16S rRNA (cytidine1402-2'-O)-methyltransferase